jgi:hypothetical protein
MAYNALEEMPAPVKQSWYVEGSTKAGKLCSKSEMQQPMQSSGSVFDAL